MMLPSPAAQLADLASRFWRFECYESPFLAVLAGEPTTDAALFRESAADHDRRYRAAGNMLSELGAIGVDALSAQERATHRLLRRELSTLRSHYEVDAHLRPSIFPGGPDFTTVFWANSTSFNDAEGAALYLARLETLPAYLRDVQANLQAGHDKGMRYPRLVLDSALANTRGIVAGSAEASPWYGPFKRSVAADKEAVRQVGERALGFIGTTLMPALLAHAEFLAGPLANGARDTLACTESPSGRDFYRVLVRHFTTTDASPEEIHALGLSEVSRLAAEIEAVATEAGYPGDVAGYRHFLSTDAQFIAPSGAALRESFESLCKRIDKRIPAFFGRLPRITSGVESVPEAMAANLPAAYAQPGPADGSAPGIFWVTSIPAMCPSYLHVPTALHEAWPGHLMHIALIQEMASLPAFRRYGAVKYSAFVEGWALYCETLGLEMGLYETPHQNYGRLEMEMWRAVRLVVDTGIHWYGWSREKAIDTMAAHLTHSRPKIEGEVARYAALPGQALAYQIGNLKMRSLRRRAEDALGERFKHRAFHGAVMTAGAVTLPVLEDLVEDWLAGQTEARAVTSAALG